MHHPHHHQQFQRVITAFGRMIQAIKDGSLKYKYCNIFMPLPNSPENQFPESEIQPTKVNEQIAH